jgi:hypothetical protein
MRYEVVLSTCIDEIYSPGTRLLVARPANNFVGFNDILIDCWYEPFEQRLGLR